MWFNRNGSGMRAHNMPGAISTTSPVGGGSGTGKVRALVSVLVSIGCIHLFAVADTYPGMDHFALHLKVAQGRWPPVAWLPADSPIARRRPSGAEMENERAHLSCRCLRAAGAAWPAAIAPPAARPASCRDRSRLAEGCRHQFSRRADDPRALPASPR